MFGPGKLYDGKIYKCIWFPFIKLSSFFVDEVFLIDFGIKFF